RTGGAIVGGAGPRSGGSVRHVAKVGRHSAEVAVPDVGVGDPTVVVLNITGPRSDVADRRWGRVRVVDHIADPGAAIADRARGPVVGGAGPRSRGQVGHGAEVGRHRAEVAVPDVGVGDPAVVVLNITVPR